MSDLYLYSRGDFVFVKSSAKLNNVRISDSAGSFVNLSVLSSSICEDGSNLLCLDASSLQRWSPDNPVLYTFACDEAAELRFGRSELSSLGNKYVLHNGQPIYLRGFIRGIVAHDHPNMTGGTSKEACIKNISQAKKFGFNLVRFHSTIPSPEFVEAADELGFFIHAEIGFAYEYDDAGNKRKLSLDNKAWVEIIKAYRNSPSLAIFCIGNEMHNAGHVPEVLDLYKQGKELAPYKLIMDNSGWGEYDRSSADIFSQHIAYFFPFKKHAEMFKTDNCWRLNGSAFDVPLQESKNIAQIRTDVRREATPLRPVLAHEAIHYIDIPDYEAMNAKFDAFAEKVGEQYLKDNEISKPRYLTELPKLVKKKKLEDIYPDYIEASRKFKKDAMKLYLERLRLSELSGFEMLQFSDCLKYENKNGIVDFFDDDKYIEAAWMKQFNADTVILADFAKENYHSGERISLPIYISHFSELENPRGTLLISLSKGSQKELIYQGDDFTLVPGLQKMIDLSIALPEQKTASSYTLSASFSCSEFSIENSWEFWCYPAASLLQRPALNLQNAAFATFINSLPVQISGESSTLVTDILDDDFFTGLKNGQDTLLFYHRDDSCNKYYLPGTLERFKPCIWDRGSNLGVIMQAPWLQQVLANGKYSGLNLYELMENGYKVNLDEFPVLPDELISGVDKPVRDRMKGLIHGIKDFQVGDTLRRFAHLFAVKVGKARLIVCTFNKNSVNDAAAAYFFAELLKQADKLEIKAEISFDDFQNYVIQETEKGHRREDVMNHFWEIDNKPVEDTLFWEECGVNLAKMK